MPGKSTGQTIHLALSSFTMLVMGRQPVCPAQTKELKVTI